MIKTNLIVITFIFLFFSSCKKHEEAKPEFEKVEGIAPDFNIPTSLINKLKTENTIGHTVSEFFFSPLKIKLFSDQERVLTSSEVIIEFEKGGGILDLSKYVTGDGSFYLSIPQEQFDEKTTFEGLYFVSDSKKENINENSYGLGCGKWVDLKTEIVNFQKKNYFKLNTIDNSYIYALTGQLIVVTKKGSQVFLSHANIMSSKLKNYRCSEIFKINK